MEDELKEAVSDLLEDFDFPLHVEQCFAVLHLINTNPECVVPDGFFREMTKFHTFYKRVRKILPPVEN